MILPDVNVLIYGGQPHCQVVEPGERHCDIFRRLCIETDIRGSRVSDAWLAALAIEWAASGSPSIAIMRGSRD